MATMTRQSLGDFGPHLAMRPRGKQVQDSLDENLRRLPPGGVLVVDFDGVEMMDYSFADEALGAIYSRMAAKEYPDRHLIIAMKENELGDALLENLEVALNRREVAAIVLPRDNNVASTRERAAVRDAWRVVGALPVHLVETLRAVMERGQVTVRELAEALKLDSATACNNRIARLYQLHLVRREAAIVPEGGRQYSYSSVI